MNKDSEDFKLLKKLIIYYIKLGKNNSELNYLLLKNHYSENDIINAFHDLKKSKNIISFGNHHYLNLDIN